MNSRIRSHLPAWCTFVVTSVLIPSTTLAAPGLYLQLGLGYGAFSGSELVVVERAEPGDLPDINPETCCPSPGLASQFRLGFSILGFGGPEFMFMATGFNSFKGGAGFVGGGVRAFPLKLFEVAGLDLSDFPIDIGLGAALGFALVGKDFAYTGSFWDFDINIEFVLASFMSTGLKFDIVKPNYSDFVYTDYNKGTGRCLDSGANQVLANSAPISRDTADCSGQGPSTTFITPQVVFTFHFDILDS